MANRIKFITQIILNENNKVIDWSVGAGHVLLKNLNTKPNYIAIDDAISYLTVNNMDLTELNQGETALSIEDIFYFENDELINITKIVSVKISKDIIDRFSLTSEPQKITNEGVKGFALEINRIQQFDLNYLLNEFDEIDLLFDFLESTPEEIQEIADSFLSDIKREFQEENTKPVKQDAPKALEFNPYNITSKIHPENYVNLLNPYLDEATNPNNTPNEKGFVLKTIQDEYKGKTFLGSITLRLPQLKSQEIENDITIDLGLDEVKEYRSLDYEHKEVINGLSTYFDSFLKEYPEEIGPRGECWIPILNTKLYKSMAYIGRLSKQRSEQIKQTIKDLNNTKMTMDVKSMMDYIQKNHPGLLNELGSLNDVGLYFIKEAPLLEGYWYSYIPSISKIDKKTGLPHVVDFFVVTRLPSLYVYSKTTKKKQNIPWDWLNIPHLGNISERKSRLIKYLAYRVYNMKYFENKKNQKKNQKIIKIESLIKEIGYKPDLNRNTKKEIINNSEIILNSFKDKGIIKNFRFLNKDGKPVRKNQVRHKIEIILDKGNLISM